MTPLRERLVAHVLLACGAVSILTTVGIVLVLVTQSFGFLGAASPLEFLFGTRWSPHLAPNAFGILPLLSGTLLVAAGAALIALPLGLATAIYLSEFASRRTKRVVKPALEVLAGIPTVAYGYVAIVFAAPLVRAVFPAAGAFNAASAALVVGVMILPMVSSLSEDALSAVSRDLRAGAYALGATKLEVALRVVAPAAKSGIAASFVLAISRAFAETMVVTLAAGATPRITADPLASIQTMTAYIVQASLGDVPLGTTEHHTLFAVALVLFLITLGLNVASRRLAAGS